MERFKIQNLTFTYPEQEIPVLRDVSMELNPGDFAVLAGPSGCGKSTMLRQLKTVLAPHGKKEGTILFNGEPLGEVDNRTQSAKIGFVMQDSDSKIVTDKVWHELAFGLESLGVDTTTIRGRVAEMVSFFGSSDPQSVKIFESIAGRIDCGKIRCSDVDVEFAVILPALFCFSLTNAVKYDI